MQLISTEISQAIRFIEPKDGIGQRSPVPLIKALEDRYGFAQVPRTIPEMNLLQGVNFLQGYFQGKLIDKFSVYNNGLLCECKQDTAYSDQFLDEIFSSLPREFDIEMKETRRSYLSQVEVMIPIDIGAALENFTTVGQRVFELLKQYDSPNIEEYRFSSFKMHYDQTGKANPRSPEFLFERRAAEPYSANIYFSSAPLRTSDHMQVLDLLEKTFS